MNWDAKNVVTPTPRERELMMLIAQGMQNKNIAYELKISENTVRAHIGNVMRKFNLRNRTQIAMVIALEVGQPVLRREMPDADGHAEALSETIAIAVWKNT